MIGSLHRTFDTLIRDFNHCNVHLRSRLRYGSSESRDRPVFLIISTRQRRVSHVNYRRWDCRMKDTRVYRKIWSSSQRI